MKTIIDCCYCFADAITPEMHQAGAKAVFQFDFKPVASEDISQRVSNLAPEFTKDNPRVGVARNVSQGEILFYGARYNLQGEIMVSRAR